MTVYFRRMYCWAIIWSVGARVWSSCSKTTISVLASGMYSYQWYLIVLCTVCPATEQSQQWVGRVGRFCRLQGRAIKRIMYFHRLVFALIISLGRTLEVTLIPIARLTFWVGLGRWRWSVPPEGLPSGPHMWVGPATQQFAIKISPFVGTYSTVMCGEREEYRVGGWTMPF